MSQVMLYMKFINVAFVILPRLYTLCHSSYDIFISHLCCVMGHVHCPMVGGGAKWALMELNFTHVSEKAKLPGMCPSFAGNVGETQFHQCPFIPPSYL